MSRRWMAATAAAVAVATGCAANVPGDLNVTAERTLAPLVQHIREVAKIGTYAQLRAAVADLEDEVQTQQRAGNVSVSRATAIEDAADALLHDARGVLKPPPTSTPTPTPTSLSPTPSPTPTSESPSPSPTSESPSPSAPPTSHSPSPEVSASVGALQ